MSEKTFINNFFCREHTQGSTKFMRAGQPKCTPAFRPNTYSTDDDNLLYPYSTDESTFNPYDAPGAHYKNNLMYTR